MGAKAEFLVGLDIGTARVAAVVAERQGDDLNFIGVGTAPCEGVRRGVVANLEATGQAAEEALKEAELAAGIEIHSVIADVGGDHIRGRNSHSVVAVPDREVRVLDIERALAKARSIALPEQLDILHVLPRHFVVDGLPGVREPLGTVADRLEAHVHIVTTDAQCARNVLRCCARLGLHVSDLVMAPLASAAAVLDAAEKELGVAVLDIGAGTTDVLVFRAGTLAHTAVLPFGGHHVTSDIAAGLRTPFRDAELLKQRHGAVHLAEAGPDEQVEVPAVGAREARLVSRRKLALIIEARVEEILLWASDQIARSGGIDDLGAGVVLTGGTASLPRIVELAQKLLQCPVRRGVATGFGTGSAEVARSLDTPSLAAAVGLVQCGLHPLDRFFDLAAEPPTPAGGSIADWLRRWIPKAF